MPVFVDPPPFPVIDPNPSLGRIVSAFRPFDWALTSALTVAGYAWGFRVGRMPWGGLFALSGVLGGLQLGYIKSSTRLLGYERNEDELARFGYFRPPAPAPDAPAAAASRGPIDTKY